MGFEHLQRLRAYALDRGLKIPVIQADAGRLPFADDSFDVVVLASLVHLTDRPGPMLREAERVCRPDGRLVIAGPWDRHPKSMVWVKTLLRGGKPPTMKTWPFNVPKLRRLLPRSTFVSARTERLIGYVVTVWRPDREPLRA